MHKKLEWSLNCDPIDFFISFQGITFHSWEESSCNLLTRQHWRLIIFSCILTFFRPKCFKSGHKVQGRSEGTSSVAFEVLIINCQIYFINLFIFNCLALNIKLFIFKLCDVKFFFSENHVFCKQKRTAVYGLMDACP